MKAIERDDLDIISGFTAHLPTGADLLTFSNGLEKRGALLEAIVKGLNVQFVSDQGELIGLDDIGDASIGLTIGALIDDTAWRIDVVPFRTDDVGAVVIVQYLEGSEPRMTVLEAVLALDRRIVEISSLDD